LPRDGGLYIALRRDRVRGRRRDECLNVEWFNNLREAKVVIKPVA
jgi:hypothetical protein